MASVTNESSPPEYGVLENLDPNAGLGLTREQAARVLGVSTESLRLWEIDNRGPRCVRISERKCFYPWDDLSAFIASRTRGEAVSK
jgi:hypothetical protein